MLKPLLALIDRASNWRAVALLLVALFVGTALFEWRRERLLGPRETGPKVGKVLDARQWGYTPADAKNFLESLGPDGRKIYAVTEVTLDVAYPLAYGLLLAVLIRQLYPSKAAWLAVTPLLAAALDLLENALIVFLIWSYSGQESRLARLAAVFTVSKSMLLVVCLALVFVGAVRRFPNAPANRVVP